MKAICKNDSGWYARKRFLFFKWETNMRGPRYREIVTVIKQIYYHGDLMYSLLEYNGETFFAECFLPISEAEATKIIEERINH